MLSSLTHTLTHPQNVQNKPEINVAALLEDENKIIIFKVYGAYYNVIL